MLEQIQAPKMLDLQRSDWFAYVDEDLKKYASDILKGASPEDLIWLNSVEPEKLGLNNHLPFEGIANLQRLNDVNQIDKYLEVVNKHLLVGSYFITCFETKNQRKNQILNKYPPGINYIYYGLDFVIKRFFPKWGPTKKLNQWITGGRSQVLTLTESFGRLISSGFHIVDHNRIGDQTYVIAKKSQVPIYDKKPTYGFLIKLQRIGYQGKRIKLLKFRTMHPYSEYLQEFLYEQNGTVDGDKIINDFRVTSWGKIMRALWVDELPMIFNWLKGDLKLVGVLPFSLHQFET